MRALFGLILATGLTTAASAQQALFVLPPPGAPVFANATIPAGNAVTSTTETAFASKFTIPPGAASALCTVVRVHMGGFYNPVGLSQSIIPRIRLGGVAMIPAVTVTGLLGTSGSPWEADAEFVLTSAGWIGGGILYVADNQFRVIRNVTPVAGPDMTIAQDVTASAQWGGSGNSITLQQMSVEIVKPTSCS